MALAPPGQGRPRPWTPAGGGSAPRPLRSDRGKWRAEGAWASPREAKGEGGAFSKGDLQPGRGNPPTAGFKRLLGYGDLWRGRKRGSRGGNGKSRRPGGAAAFGGRGALRSPGQPNQSRGRGARRAPLPLLCARCARPPPPHARPQRPPYSPGLPRPATGRSRPAGGGTNPVEVRRSLRSQHNHRDQDKEQDEQPHNDAQYDPDRLVAGGGRRLGQRLPVLG